MTLKIYGIPESTCTSRVLTVLAEKGVTDYEFPPMGKGDMKAPEHLARQPFGKIPAIDDDGFVLCESRAICKYLAKKYANQGTKLIPDDGDVKGYGIFEQACSYEMSYFNPPAESICFEKLFKQFHGKGPADEQLVTQYKSKLEDTLKVYDGILAKQAYLAGDEVSLADLFHLPYGHLAKEVGFQDLYDPYPNVKRWFESLEARESWKTVPSIIALFARMGQAQEQAAK
ncbi:Glutathione S-transferase [Lachnellula occidentalis]|uniref:glutathione transferase n=1 Tax=Lachnellula occidentalis TaxID=215460 RepID=A0A8H8UI20_9HELO|nr:Glutathione S-transferase [Lachnellula occidentalis]